MAKGTTTQLRLDMGEVVVLDDDGGIPWARVLVEPPTPEIFWKAKLNGPHPDNCQCKRCFHIRNCPASVRIHPSGLNCRDPKAGIEKFETYKAVGVPVSDDPNISDQPKRPNKSLKGTGEHSVVNPDGSVDYESAQVRQWREHNEYLEDLYARKVLIRPKK